MLTIKVLGRGCANCHKSVAEITTWLADAMMSAEAS